MQRRLALALGLIAALAMAACGPNAGATVSGSTTAFSRPATGLRRPP